MARTLSVQAETEGAVLDLDGTVVDGLEALRQRISQRLRFRQGTWKLDKTAGTAQLLGHLSPRIAGQTITAAIRDEGGDEVTDVVDVEVDLDHNTRVLSYSATVLTVYGPARISETGL